MNPVYDIFNDIANNMVTVENKEEFLSNTVRLVGASGKEHVLSIAQAQLLLGVLDGSHQFLTDYNPLEFLLFSYQFQDKIKLKYVAVQYQIIYDADDDSIFVSGVTRHPMTVVGHPDYVAGASVPIETFQTTIPNVGLYGGLALVNCIATQSPDFAPVKGSFGGSFIFEFDGGKQSIRRYVPAEIDEPVIHKEELQEALDEAVKKFVPSAAPKVEFNGIKDTSTKTEQEI
ncbi:hypothetical protein MZD04_gp002 [Pseudomonas phage Psa21]|uniref:Uncharacterized protein n=1 Tax=Pseudomonas phage Psa21 TaxID=2530023 RepID=A0A481W4E6_9CAUD|nr:hypothetical protein MZD04_gp002 [Pseudomonas phage Psa21]QBJ02532.1 hypothetical protein PSA21_2 [Pseudomonas phage Psa21]